MAQDATPLLRDFLGVIPYLKEDCKQLSHTTAPDYPVDLGKHSSSSSEEVDQEVHTGVIPCSTVTGLRESSSARPLVTLGSPTLSLFQSSSEGLVSDNSVPYKGCNNWLFDGPKHREAGGIKGPREMDSDALDSCRMFKRSRLDDKKAHDDEEAALEDLRLSMQPPQQGVPKLSTLCPLSASKLDASTLVSRAWDNTRPTSLGISGPHTDNACKDSPVTTNNLHMPPADEGSRTGLKGLSGYRAMTEGPSLPLSRSKSVSHLAGPNSTTCLASQETAPITRQLTIFYGGQAHVFEDVSADKAEAIITLAGSSGRSWSTSYSPRRNSGMFQLGDKASLASIEREQAKSGSKQNLMNDMEANDAMPIEMHNAIRTLSHKGLGGSKTRDSASQRSSSPFNHIGKKPPEGRSDRNTGKREMEPFDS